MKNIINKFTMGKPKQMIGPTLWLFFEGFSIGFPAVAIYFAINIIIGGFTAGKINYKQLWLISLIMFVLFILQILVSTGTFLGTFLPGARNSAKNKQQFIQKIRALSLGYFARKDTGELINTFTGDFLALEQSMVGVFTGLFGVVLSCILTSIFVFVFNPKMAVAFYIALPVAAIILSFSMSIFDRLSAKNRKAKDKVIQYLNEYLLGIKTLKSYNLTGQGFKKLKMAYQDLMNQNIRTEVLGGSLLTLALTFVKLGLPLMCLVGAYLMLGGELSLVAYLSLIILGTKILAPLLTWVRFMSTLRLHYVSAKRIDNVMQQTSLPGKKTLPSLGDIEFKDAIFSYGSLTSPVLDHLSFTIKKNQLTAIVGPSGAGKSTIIRLIARFWDINSGHLTCHGHNLCDINPTEWLNNVSMVLQDVYLFNDTIKENIIFGTPNVTDQEIISIAKKAGCHDFIMALPKGYDTLIGEGGSTLSGGEKQRISIARALFKNAPILLLDEPTASLDSRNEHLVQQALTELVKDKTVIIIAHRLKTIMNADKIIVLNNGTIEEQGTHEDLLAKGGLYHRLWTLQNEAKKWHV